MAAATTTRWQWCGAAAQSVFFAEQVQQLLQGTSDGWRVMGDVKFAECDLRGCVHLLFVQYSILKESNGSA